MSVNRDPLCLEVPFRDGAGGSVAVRCLPPDPAAAAELGVSLWVFAVPGATEDWRYFHEQFTGHEGEPYSFAEFLRARGVGVAAIDTPGTGDSSFAGHGDELTLEVLGAACRAAVEEVRRRLRDGALAPGLDPVGQPVICGVGHSAGGGVSVLQQARYAGFDLLAVLGMPVGPPASLYAAGGDADSIQDSMDDSISQSMDVDDRGMVRLHPLPPGPAREAMFLGVPGDVIDEFYARSLPFPPGMLTLMMEGTLVPFARDVRVPVFAGFGELDLAADPLDERDRYPSSPDVTVHVQRGAGHFHNFAPTREELWATLFNWMWSRARGASEGHAAGA